MKKLFLLFMLFYIPAFAISPGAGFYAEFGKSFLETHYKNNVYDTDQTVSYTDIEVHYNFSAWDIWLIPYGEIKTWFLSDKNILANGKPFCDIYFIGLKIKYMGITLYCEHYCAHPVYSNEKMWQVEDYRMGQNSDKIAIRYEFN